MQSSWLWQRSPNLPWSLLVSGCLAREEHSLRQRWSGHLSHQGSGGNGGDPNPARWRVPLVTAPTCAAPPFPEGEGLRAIAQLGQGDGAVAPAAAEAGALSTRHAKAQTRSALPPLREANAPDQKRVYDYAKSVTTAPVF